MGHRTPFHNALVQPLYRVERRQHVWDSGNLHKHTHTHTHTHTRTHGLVASLLNLAN